MKNFTQRIDSLKKLPKVEQKVAGEPLPNFSIQWPDNATHTYALQPGQQVFKDSTLVIKALADELKGLSSLRLAKNAQTANGTELSFTTTQPVKILIGYFNDRDAKYLRAPQLENDASANDYGQAEAKIRNAVWIEGMPPVNVHTYSFGAGTHKLSLGKGIVLVFGAVADSESIRIYDAALQDAGTKNIDWLFD